MSLNWKEIDLALSELDLEGAFIQQIVQPGYDSLALHVYKQGTAKTVLICLAAGACRIHETHLAIPKNDKPLRFMEFMRSRIKGSRIVSARQLGQERVIQCSLLHGDETFYMYIRLWSGAANIIITNTDNSILDTFYRRPSRGEITGKIFVPPQWHEVPDEKAASRQIRSFDFEDAQSASFNENIDRWYSEHAQSLSRESLLEQAERFYTASRTRLETALDRLRKKQLSFQNADQFKHFGDLILANGHLIDGSSDLLACEDYETGQPISIRIDRHKSAAENAADYYESYKKAQSGAAALEDEIAQTMQSLRELDSAYEAFQNESNPFIIQQMLRKQTKPEQQLEKKYPGLAYNIQGWTILVGRNAGENDALLRRHIKGQDMWLHTRDWAGGYVFIKHRPNKSIPLEILIAAGNLAVYHSKGRRAGTADLYYTQAKNLKRVKNGPKGLVIPANEKNLCIKCDQTLLREIEKHLIV